MSEPTENEQRKHNDQTEVYRPADATTDALGFLWEFEERFTSISQNEIVLRLMFAEIESRMRRTLQFAELHNQTIVLLGVGVRRTEKVPGFEMSAEDFGRVSLGEQNVNVFDVCGELVKVFERVITDYAACPTEKEEK